MSKMKINRYFKQVDNEVCFLCRIKQLRFHQKVMLQNNAISSYPFLTYMVFFVKEHLSVRSSLLAKMLYMGTERVQSITSSFAKDMAPTFIGLLPFKSAIPSFNNSIWIHIYFLI